MNILDLGSDNGLIDTVAEAYESALDSLRSEAVASSGLDMSTTVVHSTNVQIQSAILEMAQGVVKNATDQVKKSGSNISR